MSKTDSQVENLTIASTNVTVKITKIKYCISDNDKVVTDTVVGKLNITECKKYAKEHNGVFITSEIIKENFAVPTHELYLLKGIL